VIEYSKQLENTVESMFVDGHCERHFNVLDGSPHSDRN